VLSALLSGATDNDELLDAVCALFGSVVCR
jgi:hypothetical protein